MKIRRGIITVGLALIAFALLSGCDESTEAHLKLVEFTEGVADSGYVYLDVTIENAGNGSAREVSCLITIKEDRTDTVLTEITAYFDKGGIIEPDEQVTERVLLLYNPEMLDLLIQYEEKTDEDGNTVEVPLEPIIYRSFELDWQEV